MMPLALALRLRALPLRPRHAVTLLLAATLLLVACSGDDDRVQELEARLDAVETRLDALQATPTPVAQRPLRQSADGTSTPSAATPEPTAVSTPTPTPTPPPVREDLPSPVVRYIGNTAGDGIALRSACAEAARAGGAWPERTQVEVVARGVRDCEGWAVARVGGTVSWVAGDYLLEEPPPPPVVVGTLQQLADPVNSAAFEFCVTYEVSGATKEVCKTFPMTGRHLWTDEDRERYGHLTDEQLTALVECWREKQVVGQPVDECVFRE